MARQMYSKKLYPSNMDVIWMIHNNHIKNCDVMVRYIDVVQYIWGKDVDALRKSRPPVPNLTWWQEI